MATLAEAAENAQSNPAEQIQVDELPDLELLEFLGKWETDEGEWIDPNLLIEAEIESLLGPTAESGEQDTQGQSNDD